ncbi:unnamed protein product [Alternaria alternata]
MTNKYLDNGVLESSLYFFARRPEYATIKPYALRYQPDDDLPRTNFVAEKRRIKVHDIRKALSRLRFEECGFKIFHFEPSMSLLDYADPQKIRDIYLRELREKVKENLGASQVYVLDYAI